jgi:hypothetical protein
MADPIYAKLNRAEQSVEGLPALTRRRFKVIELPLGEPRRLSSEISLCVTWGFGIRRAELASTAYAHTKQAEGDHISRSVPALTNHRTSGLHRARRCGWGNRSSGTD